MYLDQVDFYRFLESFDTEVHVNRFYMDYYDSGEVSQFHSDLSLFDINVKEVVRKTISVNDPLRYGGITIYQTDWSLSALQIMKDEEGPFNLAMAPLKINGDKKLYGTFLPIVDANSTNLKGLYVLFECGLIKYSEVHTIFLPYNANSISVTAHFFINRSMLARDMQSIVLYDQEGKFA